MSIPGGSPALLPTPRELEIKLRGTPEILAQVMRADWIVQAALDKPRLRHLHTTYFDTPDGHLRRNLTALRLRKDGRRWQQTLKRERAVLGGLHERDEIEHLVRRGLPDFELYDYTEFEPLFTDAALRQAIQPLFVTHFRRLTRTLQWDGSRIEVAFDHGEVRTESRSSPLCELELELKGGEADALFDLARRLCETFPLRLDDISKAERGFALALPEPTGPVKYAAPSLAASCSPSDALTIIASACLAHLQANEAGVLDGDDDPEYVHQGRVALRRLRAVIGLFRPVATSAALQAIDGELRGLARTLGVKRDWDIFCLETMIHLPAELDVGEGRAMLNGLAQCRRREAGEAARDALAQPRYTLLLLALARTLHARDWQVPVEGGEESEVPMQIEAFARATLDTARARVIKRARRVNSDDPDSYHAWRIALKKLRYGGECFTGLYPGKPTRLYLEGLAELQSHLGHLNDTATTLRLADLLRTDCRDPAALEMLGALRGYAVGRLRPAIKQAGKAWRRIKRAAPFWA